MSDGNTWRHGTERHELVERVIQAEKARNVAERKASALMGSRDDVTHLVTRIVELEEIVERLNAKLAGRNQRKAS